LEGTGLDRKSAADGGFLVLGLLSYLLTESDFEAEVVVELVVEIEVRLSNLVKPLVC